MITTPKARTNEAFTRLDVAAIIAAIGLLSFIIFPLLANTRETSPQAVCNNNLKRIGQAFHMWASDHDERFPFFVPEAEGGLLRAIPSDANRQFMVLSNELRNPAVLRCPGDSPFPPRSFNALGTDRASYFVAHARYGFRSELLSGDRNISGMTSTPPTCQIFLSNVRLSSMAATWNLNLHPGMGHVLLSGGEVEFLAPSGLQRVVAQDSQSNSNVHLALSTPFF